MSLRVPHATPESPPDSRIPDFHALLNALPGLYLILLPDEPRFTIAAANDAYASAISSSAEDIAGRGLFEVFPNNLDDGNAANFQNLRESLHQVLATKAPHTMPPQSYVDASDERYRSTTNSPMLGNDGEVQFLIHRVEDITDPLRSSQIQHSGNPDTNNAQHFIESQTIARERREIEQRLLAIEARYSLAFAKAPIGMVLLSPDGKVLEVNQSYIDSLGYTREQLTARDSSFITHPDDIQLTRDFFATLREGPKDTASIEKRYFRKDGGILWARASATLRRDDHGNPAEVIAIVEDITERKRAEERLSESQAQLRATYDSTYEYIGLLSLDGTVLDCNRASLEFAGNKREDVIGMPFWDTPWFALTPGASEAVREGVALAARGEFVRYEAPLRRPSGAVITFDFSIHPVRNDRGEVIFLVPEGRDVTEQNRAAQQIEEDRRRWRELFMQTPAAIALLRGPDHRIEWVNPLYEALVARPAVELIGKPVVQAVPEAAQQAYIDLLDEVYRSGKPFAGHESLIRLRQPDGAMKEWYLDFVYLPTRDTEGNIDGIFVHVTDVTDAVLARTRIEESERQFRTLAETIPHLAWMADEKGDIYWYNRRWYDFTGTSFEEVKGWGWQIVHDPKVLPDLLKRWRGALVSGEPFEMTFPLRASDGSFRSFLTRVEPVKDSAARVVRWFGTNTDITEQRNTEDQLRRMNRELEEFAYVASHDLQEPLRMVNIYTQKIIRDPAAGKEKLDQYSAFVRDGVERMEALIHDLLTFSRTVHIDEAPPGTADLSAALADALHVLKDRIAESGATIHAPSLPPVRGETSQLTHVFQNVLSNALKYRRKDVPPVIDISVRRAENRWILIIRDNGIGFEPQYAERIFGLFKRLHKEDYPGTGLGLAICKRIVERYGGRIWAEGNPDAGATIFISLNAVEE